MHSGDGRQLWARSFPPTVRLAHAALWRTSHDAVTPPEILLLGTTSDSHTSYSVLDAHHGLQTSEGTLPFPVTQVDLHLSPSHTQDHAFHLSLDIHHVRQWNLSRPVSREGIIGPCEVGRRREAR